MHFLDYKNKMIFTLTLFMKIQAKFFVWLNKRILPVTAAQTPREVLNRVDSNCLKGWIWSDISKSLIQNWYQQSPNIMDIKSNILDFGILTLTLNFYFKNLMLTSHLENTSQAMWRFLHGWKNAAIKTFRFLKLKLWAFLTIWYWFLKQTNL